MNEQKWLRRIVFLETVAGVPGMARPSTPRPPRTHAHTRAQLHPHCWHERLRAADELMLWKCHVSPSGARNAQRSELISLL